MPGSAILSAILTNLNAASVFDGYAALAYDVMERASASCAVVSLAGGIAEPSTLSRTATFNRTWMFRIEVFLKDTGDANSLLERTNRAFDSVVNSLTSDDTLQGTCDGIIRLEGSFEPGRAMIDAGGATWLPVVFTLNAIEYS